MKTRTNAARLTRAVYYANVASSVELLDLTDNHSRTHTTCRVADSAGAVVFDSNWLAVRFADRRAAKLLGMLVAAALDASVYRRPPGHAPRGLSPTIALEWNGNLDDDCVARTDDLVAHAEWMSGPRKGGTWFCAVSIATKVDDYLFHASVGITPTSGVAARWICETIVAVHRAGTLPIFDDVASGQSA